ncbi:site-specific integrase [Lentzea roselyniae]|uniref:Site-specific integrase n=2 Tax=Lentzea TaxID=165301 RepID=A0ABP6ZXB2_9PSEU
MARKKRPEGTRAPNGASSIYYGADGKWHGRVTMGVLDNGKPDRRHVKRATEAEVITAVRELERERDSGNVRKPGKPQTLESWLTHWLYNIAEPSVRRKSFVYYEGAVRLYLIPGLGAHKVQRLTPEHVEKLYAKLQREGHSGSVRMQVHRTLRAALNEALRRGNITRNPVMLVKSPKVEETEVEPFTVDEAQHILNVAKERRNGVRFAVALSLGLRRGEALGLKWTDLDTKAGTLTIRRALQRHTWQHGCDDPHECGKADHKVKACPANCTRHKRKCPAPCPPDCKRHARACPKRRGGGLVVSEVKSRAGRRVINVPEPLLDWLRAHDDEQDEERALARELWDEGGWMFTQPTGRPIDPRADHGEWKALLKAAGVRDARLHDARHTAATMLLVLGVPDRAVMDVMGWSSAAMKLRYMHVPDTLREKIAEQVGGLLWSDEGDVTPRLTDDQRDAVRQLADMLPPQLRERLAEVFPDDDTGAAGVPAVPA